MACLISWSARGPLSFVLHSATTLDFSRSIFGCLNRSGESHTDSQNAPLKI
jgi:hypothetical protein